MDTAVRAEQPSLTVNAIMNAIGQVSGVLFPLVTFPYISRVLQPEGLGKVSFAQAIVAYFAMIASLGIPLYGTREAAKVRDDKRKLSQLAAELFTLNLIMTFAAFAAFAVFMALSKKTSADPLLFWICTLPVLFGPVGFGWLFSGLEEFTFVTIRTIAFRFLTLIAIFVFVHKGTDFVAYALIVGLNATGANLINLFYARRYFELSLVNFRDLRIWKHMKPVLLVFALGAVISIYTSLDKIMLGFLTNDSQVGYYMVGDRLVKVVVMMVTTLGAVMLPRVSYCLQNNQDAEYGRLANLSIRIVSLLSFPAALGLVVIARPLVLAFSGSAFVESILPARLMSLNVIFIAISNFISFQVLYPQNKENLLIISVLTGAIVNFGLNWLLIPTWHATGAAASTLIAECGVTTAQIIISQPYYRFVWPLKQMLQYGVIALFMAAMVYFSLPILESTLLQLIILVPLGMAMYMLFILLRKDELVLRLLRKFSMLFARAGSVEG